MSKPEYVETAQRIATEAHCLQKRWSGEPYITHQQAVAAAVAHLGPEFEAAAWLHDVCEDTPTTCADLTRQGIPAAVVDAVRLLTRTDGQSYLDGILALAPSPIARAVKVADIGHNLSTLPPRSHAARAKYELARHVLAMAVQIEEMRAEVERLQAKVKSMAPAMGVPS